MTGASERTILDEMADWSRSAYWLALRVTGSPETAEDAVQEAYVQAIEQLGNLDDPARDARAWFLGLVANRARNGLRSEVRRRKREIAVEKPPAPDGRATELRSDARAALGQLDEEFRLPIHLCCEQGLTQREAATILDVPERTLARRVSEGMERLRRMLGVADAAAVPAALLAGWAQAAPPVPAALAHKISTVLSSKAASAAAAVAAAATASASASLGLLAKTGLGIGVAGLAAAAVIAATGLFSTQNSPEGKPRILWIGSGSTSALMSSAARAFEAHGRLRPEQMMCRQFFRIDQVSQWRAAGKAKRVESLMAALQAAMTRKKYDYVGVQVSGAIFWNPEGEKHVPELLDELCAMINASDATPLLFEHWSENPARMRQYCLGAARRNRARVVFCGSTADEVRSAGGLKYVPESGQGGPLAHYLGTCCLYATLTGESPEGLPPPETPFGTDFRLGRGKEKTLTFSPDDVRRIQRGAWEVYRKYAVPLRKEQP